MTNKKNRIPLKELNLTSRFLFDEVMEDRSTYQDVLSIIFGKDIVLPDATETEKELRVSPLARSVRMDVISMDNEQTVYNTEMQNEWKSDLARRSRYYQALVDTNLLEPGIPDYNTLNETYIILIMTFDLFGYKKYQYTFKPRCMEIPELMLEDKATRIFLSTKGENKEEVSPELVEFLHYATHTTDEVAGQAESERVRRIHDRVCKVRTSEEVGVRYMQAWEEKYYEREEGRLEGLAEGQMLKLQELVEKKLQKGKSIEEIADALEESTGKIQSIIESIQEKSRQD